ncbi:WD repeat-containing protein 55-like [Babylonia areolata]|uniref:WD repeat-containing protein 55-like n=1 Tax=Babylonia areolata TaxID=304850 RepID=UPI003FD34894
MAEANEEPRVPADIKCDDLVMSVDCHPSRPLLALGSITGAVTLHSYSVDQNERVRGQRHHKKSCRAVRFSPGGRRLYTVGKDKSLWCVDVDTGGIRRKIKPAHESAINSLLVTGERFVATGDDEGTVKVWDMRSKAATMELHECEDFISDMILDQQQRILLATSGDGTLTAFNIRQKKMVLQSELHDSELLSLCAIKGEKKLVCGSGDGVLYLFNWGEWGNMSDRFPGHPSSITCMVALTDDVILTGSSDGLLRAVNILPNRFLGVVGEHQFDVEGLALTHDRHLLVSSSHDQCLKFWSVADIHRQRVQPHKKARHATKSKRLGTAKNHNNFFAGLAEEEREEERCSDDDDDDDSSDDDSD